MPDFNTHGRSIEKSLKEGIVPLFVASASSESKGCLAFFILTDETV